MIAAGEGVDLRARNSRTSRTRVAEPLGATRVVRAPLRSCRRLLVAMMPAGVPAIGRIGTRGSERAAAVHHSGPPQPLAMPSAPVVVRETRCLGHDETGASDGSGKPQRRPRGEGGFAHARRPRVRRAGRTLPGAGRGDRRRVRHPAVDAARAPARCCRGAATSPTGRPTEGWMPGQRLLGSASRQPRVRARHRRARGCWRRGGGGLSLDDIGRRSGLSARDWSAAF